MRSRWLVLVVAAAIGTGFATVALGEDSPAVDPPNQPTDNEGAHSTPASPEPDSPTDGAKNLIMLPCSSAQQDLVFPNFWAGPSLDGLNVSAVLRRCDLPVEDEAVRANYVSYIYGDCIATDHEGCAPPIEVQTWPAEERNKESLSLSPDQAEMPGTDTTVSGVPATRYDDGDRLEIYHPDVTIVIFGDDPTQIDLFAVNMVEGPRVLAELSLYGIFFTPACLDDVNYCVAKPAT